MKFYGIGVVLYEDGKPTLFESKKLDLLSLGITFNLKGINRIYPCAEVITHLYLYGNHFVVTMDQESLKYFCDQKELKGHNTDRQISSKTLIFPYDTVKVL